jgi:single-strand DNA-binding protein
MPNYAKIILVGHTCGDPETRDVGSKRVANFTVAVNDPFGPKDRDGKPIAVFYKISAWERLADVAVKYLKKGDPVMVEGRLSMDSYTTRDGEKRTDPKVHANDLVLLGGGPRSQDTGNNRHVAPRVEHGAPAPQQQPDDLPF